MLESIQELSAQKAEQFLDTFYFQYGHRSIADLAHLVFGLEQISILAAIAVVDEPVWDGQERSTRYQPFQENWLAPARKTSPTRPPRRVFAQTAEGLFAAYEGSERRPARAPDRRRAAPRATEPRPRIRRTLRARAFDVARSLLPLATHTSVGQIVSARVLERQIGRLLGSPYAEIRAIGAELKASCQVPAEAPLSTDAPQAAGGADAGQVRRGVGVRRPRPSLSCRRPPASCWPRSASPIGSPRSSWPSRARDPLREIVATLLYRHDAAATASRQIATLVDSLERRAGRTSSSTCRSAAAGAHDELLREHRGGYALVFDVLVDLGSFRDLHRHRRCVQIQQPLTWSARLRVARRGVRQRPRVRRRAERARRRPRRALCRGPDEGRAGRRALCARPRRSRRLPAAAGVPHALPVQDGLGRGRVHHRAAHPAAGPLLLSPRRVGHVRRRCAPLPAAGRADPRRSTRAGRSTCCGVDRADHEGRWQAFGSST